MTKAPVGEGGNGSGMWIRWALGLGVTVALAGAGWAHVEIQETSRLTIRNDERFTFIAEQLKEIKSELAQLRKYRRP